MIDDAQLIPNEEVNPTTSYTQSLNNIDEISTTTYAPSLNNDEVMPTVGSQRNFSDYDIIPTTEDLLQNFTEIDTNVSIDDIETTTETGQR
ncbi:unnamed protein product [Parnassius apollo]|uniref:(apollo) hypothetical protein n=1 Tax=Parnassius apollo TaxID=110799 RepID=A0A8S3XTA2_PARAO|nr:unnamed protein product [Parnassius apollo]